MAKYLVKITDTETGKVILEKEVNSMVAGVAAGDEPSAVTLRGTHEENLIAMNFVQVAMEAMYKED